MKLLTDWPEGLPWDEQQAFVLLDGATITDLPAQVQRLDPAANAFALYDQPPFSALRDVSPLLVTLTDAEDPVGRFHLQHARQEWGVLLFSAAPVHEIVAHLRQLLMVELPVGSPVLLRLADAAVAQALFARGDASLFGPLGCVVTADGARGVWHCQRPRQGQGGALVAPYRLSAEQDAALDRVDRRRVLLDIDTHLLKHFPDFHVGDTAVERWQLLECIHAHASELALSNPSEILLYANVVAWLDDAACNRHPQIHQLMHTPSLQSPGERVAIAAAMAFRWASERHQS
ncbi:hypothetical protein CXF97_13685 [Pseudomonas sp. Choline-02u-1]|jgi:hypothetical protein|uniref:DUF4123 domain-containing protein n=1 Tax=Pseudomonas sp. Choline-02u-1 TaxID=2058307 RepID=UPI000C33A760|nr:DUF4123 domain-containing protein [Pseudomonas sp. Choline-02u-1]PKH81623.1 hypothetical protein CXF97_13685 [Pseudomonas sp. Choline-02u-1]